MTRFQKTTIKQVAARAGVSVTTVSLFVSGQARVCSEETAGRIRNAIQELHYTPSSLVSSVQRRATRTIGVCMYSPLDSGIDFGGAFYERLWRGIVAESDVVDYSLLHYPVSLRESAQTDGFLDGRVDGVLHHDNTHSDPNTRPGLLAQAGLPIVLLTRSRNLPEGCAAVYTDEATTATLAMQHLWERGHRRIGHIAGPLGGKESPSAGDIAQGRLEGYRAFLRANGAYDPTWEGFNGSWRDQGVASLITAWAALPNRPTALFCANDTLALAAQSTARAQGWPLALVGVDNTDPTLTSVEPDEMEIGRESVRTLLRLMEGAALEDCRVAIPARQLHLRESTLSQS